MPRPGSRVEAAAAGAPASAGHAQQREVVARVEPDRLGVELAALAARAATVVSSWPGDDVRVGHDDPVAGDPAAAPGRRARRRCRAPSRRCAPAARTSGSRAIARVGRRDVRRRARDLRERVEARERAAGSAPRAAARAFSSRRIAERWIGSRSSRAPGVCSATAPTIQASPSAERRRPAARPPSPSSTPSRSAAARAAAGSPSSSSTEARMPPSSSAPTSANSGAYGRLRALGAAADRAASRRTRRAKPGQRQRADDQPLRVAPRRHQQPRRRR